MNSITKNIHLLNSLTSLKLFKKPVSLRFLNDQIRDWHLEGFDISEELINKAKQKVPTAVFSVRDIYNCGYADGFFDLVLSTEVLEHLVNPGKAISEARRISRKYCVFSVPLEPYFSLCNLIRGKNIHRWGSPPEHLWRWSVRKFSTLLHNYFNKVKFQIVFPWIIVLCEV